MILGSQPLAGSLLRRWRLPRVKPRRLICGMHPWSRSSSQPAPTRIVVDIFCDIEGEGEINRWKPSGALGVSTPTWTSLHLRVGRSVPCMWWWRSYASMSLRKPFWMKELLFNGAALWTNLSWYTSRKAPASWLYEKICAVCMMENQIYSVCMMENQICRPFIEHMHTLGLLYYYGRSEQPTPLSPKARHL